MSTEQKFFDSMRERLCSMADVAAKAGVSEGFIKNILYGSTKKPCEQKMQQAIQASEELNEEKREKSHKASMLVLRSKHTIERIADVSGVSKPTIMTIKRGELSCRMFVLDCVIEACERLLNEPSDVKSFWRRNCEELRAMKERGDSLAEIAWHFNKSYHSVRSAVQRYV